MLLVLVFNIKRSSIKYMCSNNIQQPICFITIDMNKIRIKINSICKMKSLKMETENILRINEFSISKTRTSYKRVSSKSNSAKHM